MNLQAIRWNRVGTIALATWFITLSVMRLQVLMTGEFAGDLRLYLRGSAAWLNGQDPWLVHMGTLHYAAAPPSLLLMAPFALLPEELAIVVVTALAVAASLWTLRRLGLPLWWIIWPPLVDNLWNGNPQLFIVPLLLGPAAFLAPIVKAYGIVPLVIQWRWRVIVWTAVVGLITLPILPWGQFVAHLSETAGFLTDQSSGGMSAWFLPVLVPFAAVALIVMGRDKASWWFIPALWPATQWYYTLMAMPAMTALTAAILAAPVQGLPAVAAVVAAGEVWFKRRRDLAHEPDQPATATSDGRTTRAPSS